MQTVSKQDMTQELATLDKTDQVLQNGKNCKEYGTTHYPHGWLKENASFNGCMPTIDSGIWKHHTLLIEKEKK